MATDATATDTIYHMTNVVTCLSHDKCSILYGIHNTHIATKLNMLFQKKYLLREYVISDAAIVFFPWTSLSV